MFYLVKSFKLLDIELYPKQSYTRNDSKLFKLISADHQLIAMRNFFASLVFLSIVDTCKKKGGTITVHLLILAPLRKQPIKSRTDQVC